MNLVYSGFTHPLIGVLKAILVLFWSEFIGKQLLKKILSTFFLNLAVGKYYLIIIELDLNRTISCINN
jgi:hypothetical protein